MGRKAAGRLTNVKAFRGRTMKLDDGFDWADPYDQVALI